jgi:hypothetical protein
MHTPHPTRCHSWSGRVFSAALSACVFLGGCQGSGQRDTRTPASQGICINAMSVGDWQAQDDEHVLLWAESREWAYRLTLTRPLPGLRFEEIMSVIDTNRDGRICAFGGDAILIRECSGVPVAIAALERLSIADTRAATAGAVPSGGRKATRCEKPP